VEGALEVVEEEGEEVIVEEDGNPMVLVVLLSLAVRRGVLILPMEAGDPEEDVRVVTIMVEELFLYHHRRCRHSREEEEMVEVDLRMLIALS